jgi:phosphate acetyltransferase
MNLAACATDTASHPRLVSLIDHARSRPPLSTAIVFPNDEVALRAATSALMAGSLKPMLYGNKRIIESLAKENGAINDIAIVDTGSEPRQAARIAVAAVRRGEHAALMKGSLHTDELLHAVLDPEAGLRTERRLTHTFVFDVPSYHKLFALTDAVVNIAPNLATKADALANAIDVMRALGVARPKAAIVAAVEVESSAIPATVDAARLRELAESGHFGNAIVEGPLGFDNAISAEAARIKGIVSSVAGDPDVLLVPDLNAGNIFYKSLVYLAGGECAGIVQGARVPIVLTSRADSEFSRLASAALASIMASESCKDALSATAFV